MAGLSSCGVDRVDALVGQLMPPRQARGQPLHPIYALANTTLLLDEQATQIFAMTDEVAERSRKIGGKTIRSISDIAKHRRLKDNNEAGVSSKDMIGELCEDNQQLTRSLRASHEVCDRHNDVATASLIENWIDEGERRRRFLSEIKRDL
jgi:starvation-inducible DNA-binding protein